MHNKAKQKILRKMFCPTTVAGSTACMFTNFEHTSFEAHSKLFGKSVNDALSARHHTHPSSAWRVDVIHRRSSDGGKVLRWDGSTSGY